MAMLLEIFTALASVQTVQQAAECFAKSANSTQVNAKEVCAQGQVNASEFASVSVPVPTVSPLPAASSYAAACNAAAKGSRALWVLFLSPEVAADERISSAIAAVHDAIVAAECNGITPDEPLPMQVVGAASHLGVAGQQAPIALFELRQLPLESGNHYNPITLASQTFLTEAFAVRRSAFVAVGSFDTRFSVLQGYELSLRLRGAGYGLCYLPVASVTVPNGHDVLQNPTIDEYVGGYADQLLLAAKYQTVRAVVKAKFDFFQAVRTPRHFDGVRKALLIGMPRLIAPAFAATAWKHSKAGRALHPACVKLLAQQPAQSIPQRGRVAQFALQDTPLVSVVVRTCARPTVLAQTLACLRNQTYPNFEIVLIEDGAPTAQQMVAQDFSDLPIRYHATQNNVGRGRAGNIGIEQAKGEYVCFLDDDDFYYADYIEASVAYLQSEENLDFVYTPIMAAEVDVASRTPVYAYNVRKMYPVLFDHLSLMDMCIKCRVPMSGGMFRRALYDQVGGMREDIDGDEDWAMWLRFSMVGRRKQPDALDIPRAESVFLVPADPKLAAVRLAGYECFDFEMLSDPNLIFTVTEQMLEHWNAQLQRDAAHLRGLGQLAELVQTPSRSQWPRFTPVCPVGGSIQMTALQINGYYQSLLDGLVL